MEFTVPLDLVNVTSAPSVLTSKPPLGTSGRLKLPFSAAISSFKNAPISSSSVAQYKSKL